MCPGGLRALPWIKEILLSALLGEMPGILWRALRIRQSPVMYSCTPHHQFVASADLGRLPTGLWTVKTLPVKTLPAAGFSCHVTINYHAASSASIGSEQSSMRSSPNQRGHMRFAGPQQRAAEPTTAAGAIDTIDVWPAPPIFTGRRSPWRLSSRVRPAACSRVAKAVFDSVSFTRRP